MRTANDKEGVARINSRISSHHIWVKYAISLPLSSLISLLILTTNEQHEPLALS